MTSSRGLYPEPPFSKPKATGGTYTLSSDGVERPYNSPEPFITRDSGERESFDAGAVRDTQNGKPRYNLIPPGPLRRVAELYARGAAKYESHNWTKGIPTSRFMDSLMRHVEAYRAGDRVEDHLAAVIFNAMGVMFFEGTKWDDMHDWNQS